LDHGLRSRKAMNLIWTWLFILNPKQTSWSGRQIRTLKLKKKIWLEIEKIVDKEVDFLVLNRAPATVADAALRGIPVVIKDRKNYIDFLLRVTSEAIDFRQWVDGYWKLRERRKHETPVRG
jgi:hypothetical protein